MSLRFKVLALYLYIVVYLTRDFALAFEAGEDGLDAREYGDERASSRSAGTALRQEPVN